MESPLSFELGLLRQHLLLLCTRFLHKRTGSFTLLTNLTLPLTHSRVSVLSSAWGETISIIVTTSAEQ